MAFEQLREDLQSAWRGLRRAKGFAGAAVLTLAVGLAGTTLMFALIEGVLLRPLPLRDADKVVVAWQRTPAGRSDHFPFVAADLDVLRRESRTLERVAGVGYNGAARTVAVENGGASYVSAAPVSGDFFDVLGVGAIVGRCFTPSDDIVGSENVVVIAHGLWQRRYGGSRDVIGKSIVLAEKRFTIVGVMPPDLDYPRGVEVWTTVSGLSSTLANPAFRIDLDLVGRLRPGVTLEQARGELQAIMDGLDPNAPTRVLRGLVPVVRPYKQVVVGDVRAAMLMLFAAVGLVLLIASANVANLLLMRHEARRTEFAVRAALGASLLKLIRQLVAESIVLAIAAAAVGLLCAWSSLQVLVRLVPDGLPRVESIRIDWAVVIFSFLIAFLTAAITGLLPVAASARIDVATSLRSSGRGVTTRAATAGRRALVISQVALAVAVVAAAGLLARSLLRLQTVDMGLAADRILLMQLSLPRVKYAERARHLQFLNDVVEQLEGVPGVAAATPVNSAPFAGTEGWDVPVFTAEGQDAERAAANPSLNLEAIHPNYFSTFELELVRGRAFTDADREGSPNVAIVSEDVAARVWPGQDAIGKRLKMGGVSSRDNWRTVVGVARSTRYRELAQPRATLYLPARQFLVTAQTIVVRATRPAAVVAAAARERVRAIDADVQVMRVVPFGEFLDKPLARPRFNAFVTSVFGVAALLLSGIGLYAVMAVHVRQRFAEIGLRIALGANASDVHRLVLGEGLWLASLGAIAGLAASIAGTRVLRGFLFDVHPLDPATLVASALLLIGASALASYFPARRASRVDPVAMLRAD